MDAKLGIKEDNPEQKRNTNDAGIQRSHVAENRSRKPAPQNRRRNEKPHTIGYTAGETKENDGGQAAVTIEAFGYTKDSPQKEESKETERKPTTNESGKEKSQQEKTTAGQLAPQQYAKIGIEVQSVRGKEVLIRLKKNKPKGKKHIVRIIRKPRHNEFYIFDKIDMGNGIEMEVGNDYTDLEYSLSPVMLNVASDRKKECGEKIEYFGEQIKKLSNYHKNLTRDKKTQYRNGWKLVKHKNQYRRMHGIKGRKFRKCTINDPRALIKNKGDSEKDNMHVQMTAGAMMDMIPEIFQTYSNLESQYEGPGKDNPAAFGGSTTRGKEYAEEQLKVLGKIADVKKLEPLKLSHTGKAIAMLMAEMVQMTQMAQRMDSEKIFGNAKTVLPIMPRTSIRYLFAGLDDNEKELFRNMRNASPNDKSMALLRYIHGIDEVPEEDQTDLFDKAALKQSEDMMTFGELLEYMDIDNDKYLSFRQSEKKAEEEEDDDKARVKMLVKKMDEFDGINKIDLDADSLIRFGMDAPTQVLFDAQEKTEKKAMTKEEIYEKIKAAKMKMEKDYEGILLEFRALKRIENNPEEMAKVVMANAKIISDINSESKLITGNRDMSPPVMKSNATRRQRTPANKPQPRFH